MTKPTRKERIPVSGGRDVLTVADKKPGFEYRWVIDAPGRIERFKEGGWETVTDDLVVGQPTVDKNTKLGSAITKRSGASVLVLMAIPQEWYDEDQKRKQDAVDALEATMQQDIQGGRIPLSQGTLGSYVPENGGLGITRKR